MSPIEKIVFLPVAGCGRTGPVASGSWAVRLNEQNVILISWELFLIFQSFSCFKLYFFKALWAEQISLFNIAIQFPSISSAGRNIHIVHSFVRSVVFPVQRR